MTSRKQPGVAFWAAVVVVVALVAYPLSFGPARAIVAPRALLPGPPDPLLDAYQVFYLPILWGMDKSPLFFGAMDRYCALWQRGL